MLGGFARRNVTEPLHIDGRSADSPAGYCLRCCVDPLRPPSICYGHAETPAFIITHDDMTCWTPGLDRHNAALEPMIGDPDAPSSPDVPSR